MDRREVLEIVRRPQQAREVSSCGNSSDHREHSRRAALLHLSKRLWGLGTSCIPRALHYRLRYGFQPSIRGVHREEPDNQLDLGDRLKSHHNRRYSVIRRHVFFIWIGRFLRCGVHDLGAERVVLGDGDTGLRAQDLSFNHRILQVSNELVLPFYILHQAVIVGIAYYVVGFDLIVIEKYVLIVLASFPIILALLYPISKINLLRFLFGMRMKNRSSMRASAV